MFLRNCGDRFKSYLCSDTSTRFPFVGRARGRSMSQTLRSTVWSSIRMSEEAITMNSPYIRRVTVAGAGILGTQIAFQAAVHGFDLCVYDINDSAIGAGRRRLESLKASYDEDRVASPEQTAVALARTRLTTSLTDALADADLLIEAIPERLDIKRSFYTQLQNVAPTTTIFASNSSTMLPSQLADYTGRPERFLHLHFATPVWRHNIAEIMAHPRTDPAVFEALITFSKQMGMVPIPLTKEQPGYIFNALLVPFLLAALELLVDGVADHQLIDKTWMIAKDAKIGPFGSIDQIGLTTAYNITRNIAEQNDGARAARVAAYLKERFIDTGKLGVDAGEGFYTYPNPAYLRPDFLTS
jgi:3-hydroxyacyl-CoA dehydrogenase